MDVAVSRRNARAAKPVPRKFLRLYWNYPARYFVQSLRCPKLGI